jgi:Bacterial PH domain
MAAEPIYDRDNQLQATRAMLLPGETLIAVYDGKGGGSGFIGITDRRLILQDNSLVGKKEAVTSVPYRHVTSVSVVSDKSVFGRLVSSSELAVSAGGRLFEIEFRGEEKAHHAHTVILEHITR